MESCPEKLEHLETKLELKLEHSCLKTGTKLEHLFLVFWDMLIVPVALSTRKSLYLQRIGIKKETI